VSEGEQQVAIALFEKGNHEFANKSYDAARKLYEKTLNHWKHPAAQFNLAECLILLGRPVEAYEHLKASMRFGVEPLGKEMLQRAVVRKQLLEGQLATLRVTSKQKGLTITVNGELLPEGSSEFSRIVKPGVFQIVATKEGFQTQTQSVTLFAARTETVEVRLQVPASQLVRRWATWKPWAVVGGGVLVGGVSALLYSRAIASMDDYDQEIDLLCPSGCEPSSLPASTRNLKTTAERYSTLSLVSAGAAASILAGGAVLLYLNQLHPQEEASAQIVATPTSGGAQASVTFTF
jgi:hypothetical protein